MEDHQLLTGSVDSSSHRLSSLVLFRTSPDKSRLPLISSPLTSESLMISHHSLLMRNLKMELSVMECTSKEQDGTHRPMCLMTPIQSSSTLSSLWSGSCQSTTARPQMRASTTAHSTRCSQELEPCPPLVIQQTSVSWWRSQPVKKKRSGSVLESLSSSHSDTEHGCSPLVSPLLCWDEASRLSQRTLVREQNKMNSI